MEECTLRGNCAPLTLAALRLLVPPVRLMSAVVWQTVQQKVVADYGMLEEFVSMVTEIVPELLNTQQRVQLTLGFRARLILELCKFEATADLELVQPHLNRLQLLIKAWVMEVGAANIEVSHSEFVDLVRNLLKNSDEREHFFQNIFPEEFGPTFDEALSTLMWIFLSRLEKFLPLQTFQQVASMFGEVPSVLEECMDSVSQCEELKTLLKYQKSISQLDHNDGSLDGACIISALKLPCAEIMETAEEQPQADILNSALSCTSDLVDQSLTLPQMMKLQTRTIAEAETSRIKVEEANWTPGENGTAVHLGHITTHENSPGHLQSQGQDASHLLKQCHVQLQRLDPPLSLHFRPVRPNRGLRMKKILQEEKRGLRKETLTAGKSASRKTKPSDRSRSEVSDNKESGTFIKYSFMAPVNDSSEDDSWSYYLHEDSCQKTASRSPSMADSCSNYSDDEYIVVPRNRSYTEDDSLSRSSNEDPSSVSPKKALATSRKTTISDIKAGAPKKTCKVQCFICKEHLTTSLSSHMRTHFPTGDYACPRCDSRFKLYSSFKLHLNRTCFEYGQQQVDPETLEAAKDLYKCDECVEAFRYKVALERHKQTHNALYCSVCRKVLQDAATLARHKASHRLFHCNRCEESFTLFKPLLRHCENVHKISRPFKCTHCSKTFSKLRLLIAHEWKHMGHLPFQCSQCGFRCKTDSDLITHERVHTREKPYLCSECGKTFSRMSNLLRHLNFIHSESRTEKRYSCSECEKSYKEKGSLKKHQRSEHLKELFRHPCPYCGKMLSSSTIARHKLIHTGERPFKCTMPDCDKDFRSTSEVKKHILIHHSTERPYKCDICGKGFVKMCFLKVHANIHSGEKPFVCHFCNKAFPKLYSMKRHKKLVHAFAMQ